MVKFYGTIFPVDGEMEQASQLRPPTATLESSSTRISRCAQHIMLALAVVATTLFLTGAFTQGLFQEGSEFYFENVTEKLSRINGPVPGSWKWSDVTPSRQLRWESCYDEGYDCARLDVPMDWIDPSEDQRVILAMLRVRATEKDEYKGPVFFNPGGPGGSGVYALKDHGKLLQTIVGKNHDIISWDPRGIGASVPRVNCWDSPVKDRLWSLQDVGVIGSHPGVIYDAFARATAFSQACEKSMNASSLLLHIGTTSHARDLLEMVQQTENDKLKYWGFSYGTLLGGTFAAMYPNMVDRLVSDGNVDYREWYHQDHVNFLRDTDKVMEAFFYLCHDAGPLGCAFWADNPLAIKKRLGNLLDSIRARPVILPDSDNGPDMPQLITWSHVKRLISAALYQPLLMFRQFAEVLKALEMGDGLPFFKLMEGQGSTSPICSIEAIPPNVPAVEEDTSDAFPAIMCADLPPLNDTAEEFEEFATYLESISKAAGLVNTLFRLACIGRTVQPKWKFEGPFEGNTSHGILYIANIADNVSPLVSARLNSKGFPGSVILVQNSYGHTTLSAASKCTAGYIRSYFQDGSLPDAGTTCEPDSQPFEETKPDTTDEVSMAMHGLSRANWGFRRAFHL